MKVIQSNLNILTHIRYKFSIEPRAKKTPLYTDIYLIANILSFNFRLLVAITIMTFEKALIFFLFSIIFRSIYHIQLVKEILKSNGHIFNSSFDVLGFDISLLQIL